MQLWLWNYDFCNLGLSGLRLIYHLPYLRCLAPHRQATQSTGISQITRFLPRRQISDVFWAVSAGKDPIFLGQFSEFPHWFARYLGAKFFLTYLRVENPLRKLFLLSTVTGALKCTQLRVSIWYTHTKFQQDVSWKHLVRMLFQTMMTSNVGCVCERTLITWFRRNLIMILLSLKSRMFICVVKTQLTGIKQNCWTINDGDIKV